MAEVILSLGSDVYVYNDSSLQPALVRARLPSLMFRLGETYVDPANHRPLLVIGLGNDLITFRDVTFPDAPGEEFTLPLFTARVRLLQSKYVKIKDAE